MLNTPSSVLNFPETKGLRNFQTLKINSGRFQNGVAIFGWPLQKCFDKSLRITLMHYMFTYFGPKKLFPQFCSKKYKVLSCLSFYVKNNSKSNVVFFREVTNNYLYYHHWPLTFISYCNIWLLRYHSNIKNWIIYTPWLVIN